METAWPLSRRFSPPYPRAGDSARDAVAQRRMEVGKLHDDLYLYPEGMDQRLDTLRQLTLALITEQQR